MVPARKLRAQKISALSLGGQNPMTPSPILPQFFHRHNVFSMGMSKYRSNKASETIVAVKSSNGVPWERILAQSGKML